MPDFARRRGDVAEKESSAGLRKEESRGFAVAVGREGVGGVKVGAG